MTKICSKKRGDTTEGTSFVLIRNAIVDIIFKKSPKHLQINFWKRRKPILTKLNVSRNANTTVYEMRNRGRYAKYIIELAIEKMFRCFSVTEMKN